MVPLEACHRTLHLAEGRHLRNSLRRRPLRTMQQRRLENTECEIGFTGSWVIEETDFFRCACLKV